MRERGRVEEAITLEREAVERLVGVYRTNVLEPEYRTAASYAYWGLCMLELDRKDHRAAATAIALYQAIEPRGFEEAHEAARFLCRCIVLCREDRAIAAAERRALERSYADQAETALRRAVRFGFLDEQELRTSHTFDPLRGARNSSVWSERSRYEPRR